MCIRDSHTILGIVLNFVLIEDRKSSWKKSKTLNAFFSKLGFLTFKLGNAVSQPFFELGSWMRSRRWKDNFLLYTTIWEIAYSGNWLFEKLIIQEIDYSGNWLVRKLSPFRKLKFGKLKFRKLKLGKWTFGISKIQEIEVWEIEFGILICNPSAACFHHIEKGSKSGHWPFLQIYHVLIGPLKYCLQMEWSQCRHWYFLP